MIQIILNLLLCFYFTFLIGCGNSYSNSTSSTSTHLPSILSFQSNPTDQFLVDLNTIIDGHMFKGKQSDQPHAGAHVVFKIDQNPISNNAVDYPKIYAIADGVISKVDTYFLVNNPDAPHYRYGIDLTFATYNESDVGIHYSIEPFIDPQDDQFYKPFILVEVGQHVNKGDVIAHMYLSDNPDAHIHFHLFKTNSYGSSTFQAPAIFTDTIMTNFLETISYENGGSKNYDTNPQTGNWMYDCMGFKIDETENPFENKSESCLK